jgi:AmmeMemoRadiSam system protein A
MLVAMRAAKALGAGRATIVSYANSADTAIGDADRVVGYGAVAFHRDTAKQAPGVFGEPPRGATGPPTRAEKEALLALARGTFTQFLESQTLPLPRDVPADLQGRRQGAFVTLKTHGQLRGCIGRIIHDGPLPQLVSMVAFEAAFRDPRFPPLGRSELAGVEVEISLLTPPRQIAAPREIVVGRDGVVLRRSGRSAVFLPQVATEQGWTREKMLDELCLKAGLAERCWTDRAELATFQAEVFGESHPR